VLRGKTLKGKTLKVQRHKVNGEKQISILGSTGSIGRNAVWVARKFPDRFKVRALAAKSSVSVLAEQIGELLPDVAVVIDEEAAAALKKHLSSRIKTEILYGDAGYTAAATLDGVDQVVTAMVGAAGLMPTLAAIDAGKDIALANKETLVMAGALVMARAAEKGVRVLPIDSEHSAVFQCMEGHRWRDLAKVILTASGGPFLGRPRDQFETIGVEDALNHPTWSMGPKISIDSATLMNKGLEVIEAKWLFDLSHDQIEVVVHPQSVIHSMVSFRDGSVLAQLGVPDMKGAIAYAMSHPGRLDLEQPAPDFADIGTFTFERPDFEKFPCLKLAFEAIERGGTLPAVLNAANEIAVAAFLDGRLPFVKIPVVIRDVMKCHETVKNPDLESILQSDAWARKEAERVIKK
jgi:1-deoxy-D-xylulose-5-phosphate reductoisomerase